MYFLIGVIVFIIFILVCFFYIKWKIRKYFGGGSIRNIIQKARLEEEEIPKSLSSMDSIYLENINKDFPDININELKRKAEKVILDSFLAIEKKNSSSIKNEKIKSFIEKEISDYENHKVSFSNLKFHNTVVSKYENRNGIATIYFGSSFEYFLKEDGKSKKVQDRAKVEFIYIIDINQVSAKQKVLGLNCPNCGSPITNLGRKKCSYCGTLMIDIASRVWTCNDIIRY